MTRTKCTECYKEFSEKGMGTHIWRMHGKGQYHTPHLFCKNKRIECKYCAKHFLEGKLSRHLDCCRLNPKNMMFCKQCNNPLIKKYQKKFCSRSCGATYNNLHAAPDRKRGPIAKPRKESKSIKLMTHIKWLLCKDTGKYYCNRNKKGNIRYKSPYVDKIADYRRGCKFQFSVKSYPDEFELNLINEYGWYVSNSEKSKLPLNTNGITRDHIYSVKNGFDNDIDTAIISHPANCRLLRHTDNVRKYTKSAITLAELKERIQTWDKKYKLGNALR